MSDGDCQLSPSAQAFSSVLFAFVGSIINGLSSGAFLAFITGWIAWFSVLRVLAAALYEFWITLKAGTNFSKAEDHAEYQTLPGNNSSNYDNGIPMTVRNGQGDTSYGGGGGGDTTISTPKPAFTSAAPKVSGSKYQPIQSQSQNQPTTHPQAGIPSFLASNPAYCGASNTWLGGRAIIKDVTFLGWVVWIWSALYTPLSQTIWVAVHFSQTSSSDNDGDDSFSSGSGGVKIARAIAVGVSALSLTFDTKQRYGASLARRCGSWASVTFNAWNATVCLLLVAECMLLLVQGALELGLQWWFYLIYAVFSVLWAAASFKQVPVINGSRKGSNIVVNVLVGAFAGLFVSAPAFAIWQSAKFQVQADELFGDLGPGGLSLSEFLRCEGASGWAKFSAILP
ncbi:hypothetical protein MMC25_006235 [Agyrium rufum]|nr:hypothetical protein [Agyrium rufum]